MPFAKVEVPAPVMLRAVAERPAAKVLVPCPAPTVMAAAKVEVAVPVALRVVKRPNDPATVFAKKELVEVALVSVAFVAVIFANEFVPVKELVPEKVLLLARRVDDAAVILPLQPNTPPLYDNACDALLQVLSPAPKKLVV